MYCINVESRDITYCTGARAGSNDANKQIKSPSWRSYVCGTVSLAVLDFHELFENSTGRSVVVRVLDSRLSPIKLQPVRGCRFPYRPRAIRENYTKARTALLTTLVWAL